MDSQKIAEFLKTYKSFAQKNWTLIPRKKNLDSIAELGIAIKQAKTAVLGLTVTDYCSGPEEDYSRQGVHVWVFGAKINDAEIHIKLSDDFSGDQAKCLSFHKAERPLKKPFKESENKK